MSTVTKSFTGTETYTQHLTPPPGTMDVSVTGTFVGTVVLERTLDGTNWGICATYTTATEDVITNGSGSVPYRFRCSAYTSGTINCAMTY